MLNASLVAYAACGTFLECLLPRSTACPSPTDTCRCSTSGRCRSSRGSGSPSSAATAPASPRSSTISGEQPPDRGTVWRQPGARVARLDQDVPLVGRARRCSTSWPRGSAISARWCSVPPRGGRGGARRQAALLERLGRSSTSSRSATAGASSSASSSCSRTSTSRRTSWSTRCLAAGAGACCWRARSSRSPTCSCSTSRPITSTSRPSSGSRRSSPSTAGAVVFVTHDRAFLQRLATRIVELDRGRLTSWPGDYHASSARRRSGWRARRRSR